MNEVGNTEKPGLPEPIRKAKQTNEAISLAGKDAVPWPTPDDGHFFAHRIDSKDDTSRVVWGHVQTTAEHGQYVAVEIAGGARAVGLYQTGSDGQPFVILKSTDGADGQGPDATVVGVFRYQEKGFDQ